MRIYWPSLAALLAGCTLAVADDKPDDLKALVGRWKPAAKEYEGKDVSASLGRSVAWTIQADAIWPIKAGGPGKMTFRLDPTKAPKEIDLTFADGPSRDESFVGIYKVEKGKLTLCLARLSDKNRPREFKSRAGTGHTLMTFDAVKDKP